MRRTLAAIGLLGLAATTGTEAYPEEKAPPRPIRTWINP